MEEAGISDFELLGQHAIDHWASRKRTAFGQGDLWFGTLLIDTDNSFRSGVDNSRVTVGICDWEFAGPNDPAADIAQLGCYIHLLAMSPLTTPARLVVVMAFAEALYATYFASLELPTGQDFVKSLLIMHGWEMINAATWNARQDMWCVCEGQGVRCSHIRTMVEEGAKFLRAAGSADNTEDFNWPVLDGIAWSRFLPLRSLTRA
ncbi:hypothetical protein B0H34DRAFT_667321 [Crassisporium funariophilum]|nr:hypothetical protein B0H34DRAFT_667321 [Crassisporium funariophilum]